MNMYNKCPGFKQSLIALGVAAVCGNALADGSDDVKQLTKPDSSVVVGASSVSGKREDRAFFGQYNGFRKNNAQIDLDVDYKVRDDATGAWTLLSGRNLGNENREFGFSQSVQGDWKLSFDYGELVRNYSNTVNSAVQGVGTTNLTVSALGSPAVSAVKNAAALAAAQGTGTNYDFKTTRKSFSLAAEKWLTPYLQVEANFKSENKEGVRIFGRYAPCNGTAITAKDGYGCVTSGASSNAMSAVLMLPEPVSSVTRQIEAKLNFSDEKLTLSAAYYGSFYINDFGSLTTSYNGNLWNPDGTAFNPAVGGTGNRLASAGAGASVMALAPDNQAHNLSLAGTYAISPTSRATFKYAFTRGTQHENFGSMGLAGAPRGSLDGVVDTNTAQFGITARPLSKLSLNANVRLEQRSDKTPIDKYVKDATTGATYTGRTNSTGSHTKIAGKFEAAYQLPDNYKLTGGLDYDMRDTGTPTATNDQSLQANALRAKVQDIGYRAELRKSFADNFSGVVGVGHSRRSGSRWMTPGTGGTNSVGSTTAADGTLQGNGFQLFPLFWMDSSRDKLKVTGDWSVTEALSVQAGMDISADHYYAPTFRGAQDGKTVNLHLDSSYAFTDKWKMNAWYSRGDTQLGVNGNTGTYMADMRQLGHNLGIGMRGSPNAKLDVGADFTFYYEVNRTGLGVMGGNSQPSDLPTAAFRHLNLSMFAKYAVEKNADIRINVAHQRYYSNEWYWNWNGTPFFYSDGSTVTQKDQQNVTFIGASYIYKFQ